MKYEAIVELLTHPTALEVFLRPIGADDAEITVRLTSIQPVELA